MTPAEVFYNRLYVIGDYSKISSMAQVEMNSSQKMANRYDALNGALGFLNALFSTCVFMATLSAIPDLHLLGDVLNN